MILHSPPSPSARCFGLPSNSILSHELEVLPSSSFSFPPSSSRHFSRLLPRRCRSPLPSPRALNDVEDTFTKYSGYVFQGTAGSEAAYLEYYDTSRIAAIYGRRPFLLLRRLLQIVQTFGRWFAVRYIDGIIGRSDEMFKVRAAELRSLLVELGPAFVKVAQAISSRADIIPPAYLEELSLLQDQIAPFSSEVAFSIMEQELGLPIDLLFSEISPNPVAAASLGQVYQGRLRFNGKLVAVKVQRPGVQAAIALDIYILRYLAGLIQKVAKLNTDLPEMDYRSEARNGQKFRELYGSLQDVVVPSMYMDFCTRQVLTMEWIQGQKLSEVKDLYLIEVGVYSSLTQLLEYGFYHADPHPGNLLRTSEGKLAYLDFGMMGEFKEELRDGFVEACVHLVSRDFDALAYDFVTLGYKFKFQIPSYFSLVIRSLAVLEGIALSFDPNYKVLSSAYPWIARKVLTAASPNVRSTLETLLYKDGTFRIDRLDSLLSESLRTRTVFRRNDAEEAGRDSRMAAKQLLYFTLSEKGLDALRVAAFSSIASRAMTLPFPLPLWSYSTMEEEDISNLRTLNRLVSLIARFSRNRSPTATQVNGVTDIGAETRTPEEEALLLLNQLGGLQDLLPSTFAVLSEISPEARQEVMLMPADIAGRLSSRIVARTIRRIIV
ncbi:putative aarF domain-containing protein kinase [Nymphaea thermarum]|nr:putative aarF domain-containing protein kinase [Nymphaea thermarum]